MSTARRDLNASPPQGAQVHPLRPSQAAAEGPSLPDALRRWDDARLVACLLAVDPVGLGGVHLQSAPGSVRDRWLEHLQRCLAPGTPASALRRLPTHSDESRLIGGLDLTATLKAGKPVLQTGLLAELHGEILVCPMAERLPRRTIAVLAQTLDEGEVRIERDGISHQQPSRFGLVALDEADPQADESPLEAHLAERLAFQLNLSGIDWRAAGIEPLSQEPEGSVESGWESADTEVFSPAEIQQARERLGAVTVPEPIIAALVEAAEALGVSCLRTPWWAVQAARAMAALEGLPCPGSDEVVVAARLVLGPRATRLPAAQTSPPAPPTPPEEFSPADPSPPQAPSPDAPPPASSRAEDKPEPSPPALQPPQPPTDPTPLQDLTVAAVTAALPAGLLALLAKQQGLSRGRPGRSSAQAASRAGDRLRQGQRGRPIGVRPGLPQAGHRLSLIDTLRHAAPWQTLRGRSATALTPPQPGAGSPSSPARHRPTERRLLITPDDLRIIIREPRRPNCTVFVVDASGSNALNRLSEAKGAVETLLADCYVRRDRVAVLGFRGQTAEVLLPPTRSLVRAKRSLAGLPGGGGTPMARALVEARLLCQGLARRGETVSLVLLTDGKSNITLDGRPGREQAHADAIQAARDIALGGLRCLLVDTSPKPQPQARELALALSARYIPLPQARTGEIGRIVRNSLAA